MKADRTQVDRTVRRKPHHERRQPPHTTRPALANIRLGRRRTKGRIFSGRRGRAPMRWATRGGRGRASRGTVAWRTTPPSKEPWDSRRNKRKTSRMVETKVRPSHGVLSGNEGCKPLACHPTRGACDGEIPTKTLACDALVVQSANMGSKIPCKSSWCAEVFFQHKGVGRLQPPSVSRHRACPS